MKYPDFFNAPHLFIVFILLIVLSPVLIFPQYAYSANLFIDPASPLVQVGGEITLCVNNPSGEVKWSAFEGEIERTGNSVKYKAPDRVAIDAVTAKDSAGNIGTVAVVVQEKTKIDERFSKENANWEMFTNRSYVRALLLSDDGATLWVGTSGGLEKRNAITGDIIKIFTKLNGLPDNDIKCLLFDAMGELWVGTVEGGLAHLKSDEKWEIFNEANSKLPNNWVNTLLSDGNGGLWVGTYCGLAHFKLDKTW